MKRYGLKYTRDLLEPIVARSNSLRDVMKALGFQTYSGGHANWIRGRIDLFGIDRTHFCGLRSNRGKRSVSRLAPETVFALTHRRPATEQLRRAMLEVGFLHVCVTCSQGPVWLGKELTLQIDHIDGNPLNNRRENLRFVCPNCHSQTRTYGFKNRKYKAEPKKEPIGVVHVTKIQWPSPEWIRAEIWKKPARTLAAELGVGETAVGKFCKKHGIAKPGRGYWAKLGRELES